MPARPSNEIVIESITEALFQMLKDRPLNEINITDLVKRAGVGRVSFYRNYKSKEDVIVKYLDRLTVKWGAEFEKKEEPNIVRDLFSHFYEHKDLLNLLYQTGLSHLLFTSIRDICGPKDDMDNPHAYWQALISGAIFSWCDEWVRRGMQETPEEMATLAMLAGTQAAGVQSNSTEPETSI